jgi:septal ring factor EnvC (AmiA/AmiB activator)
MNTLAKAFVFINLLLGVLFLGVSCVLFAQQENWKGKYNTAVRDRDKNIEICTDRIEKQNGMLSEREKKITDLQAQIDVLKTDLQDMTAERDQALADFREQKVKNTQLDGNLTKLSSNLTTVQEDLGSARQLLEKTESDFKTTNEELTATKDEVVKLNESLADHALNMETLRGTIDDQKKELDHRDQIIAWYGKRHPGEEPQVGKPVPAQPITAKIEGVDHVNGFVVLSVGAEDKVKKGYTFVVFRDTSYIGQVEVYTVYPTKCSARIDPKMARAPIQIGDSAKTHLGTYQ